MLTWVEVLTQLMPLRNLKHIFSTGELYVFNYSILYVILFKIKFMTIYLSESPVFSYFRIFFNICRNWVIMAGTQKYFIIFCTNVYLWRTFFFLSWFIIFLTRWYNLSFFFGPNIICLLYVEFPSFSLFLLVLGCHFVRFFFSFFGLKMVITCKNFIFGFFLVKWDFLSKAFWGSNNSCMRFG